MKPGCEYEPFRGPAAASTVSTNTLRPDLSNRVFYTQYRSAATAGTT